MWGALAVNLGLLGVSYAYHRHEQKSLRNKQQAPRPAREISVPRTDDGGPIPILYGRCRVREPWLAWVGPPSATPNDPEGSDLAEGAPFIYQMDMFFVLGIPFANGTNLVRKVWVDDAPLANGFGANPAETPSLLDNSANTPGGGLIGQSGEFYDGNSTQLFCDDLTPFAPITAAGVKMEAEEADGSTVPSFRGYLSALLYNDEGGWYIGNTPRPGAYSFEALSYPPAGLAGISVSEECNPADAALDILTGTFGKLGLPMAYIDVPSFTACAVTLFAEGHGYSRSLEGGMTGREALAEIEEQVDCVFRDNPATGKIEMKLVRPDYDPNGLLELSPSNCEIDDYQAGSWDNVVNKIRIVFTDRSDDYQNNSASVINGANARQQLGSPDELSLSMPGICTIELAYDVAERELAFRSTPIATCKVRCSRAFIGVLTGDVVALTHPEYGISKKAMRISKVDRGKPGDEKITLHLMQEVYQVHRGLFDVIDVPGVPAHR